MTISGKNGDDDDDDGGGGDKVLVRDMLSSARYTQPCSGGKHGVAPRGAVAVAVSRQWGKGAVINRSSSRASQASLLNKSLLWKMAPVAINIDRPPPHCVGGHGSICQLL
jgi:hypothetical protein